MPISNRSLLHLFKLTLNLKISQDSNLEVIFIMSTAAVTEKPLVGTIDIVLFASFVGFVLYWFCGRRKKAETALSQKLVLA